MYLPNRKGWLAVLFIVFTLAVPFAIIFYVSTESYKDRHHAWRKNSETARLPIRSKITADQVLLVKNEKIIIHRTGLVFKGLTNQQIQIDLYLLDLDPEVPYSLNFSRKSLVEGIRLGHGMYRLLSVKDTLLKLKIQGVYPTH
ncbi:hypothetical protein [Desulfobacula sp.]|uniref:hypothetical protein n=1 Tax=Desulfobacula sp. TaxID=2593537 RepID=UPI00260E0DC4|nr:hypothetical protein [Desulfobacula sp.]